MKKNRFGGRWAAFFLAAGLFSTILISCKEKDADIVKRKAMTDIINENPEFSILKEIMLDAGKSDAFRSQNMTFFMPSNAAFNKANIFSASVITSMPEPEVEKFLNSHIIETPIPYDKLEAKSYEAINTQLKIVITKKDSVVSVNGAKIARRDIETNNGYIQVIDSVYVKVIK
ncbi:MAG: fasciclin domain-containing protein [Dyadobacter fermentans]